ncbi:MAG: LysR family transcriptional regulator [Bacteroidales bacterium]
MNIKQLRYFIGIVRHRSFSRAAEELNLTQPALSLQIQKLEEECEFMLIDRSRKPLGISPEGLMFYEKALQILQLVDDLDRLSINMIDGIERQLRIGIISTLSPYLIPLFTKTLRSKHPELHLSIEELLTEDIVAKLNYNELDLGIISTPILAKNISYKPLFYEKFYMYVSPNHPLYNCEQVDMAEVQLDDMISLAEGNCFRNQSDSICLTAQESTQTSQFEYTASSVESTMRLVESLGGIALIPEFASHHIPKGCEHMLKEIKGGSPAREISAAYLKTTGLKRISQYFIDTVMASVPQPMRKKPVQNPIDTRIKL